MGKIWDMSELLEDLPAFVFAGNVYRVFLDALHYFPPHHYLISNQGGRNRTCDPSYRKPLASEIHPG